MAGFIIQHGIIRHPYKRLREKPGKKQERFSRWPDHTNPLAAQAALQKYPGSVEAQGNLVNHTHRHALLKRHDSKYEAGEA